jgi:succinyl-diaminopimelate desuccinylase
MDYLKVLTDMIAINTTVPPGLNYPQMMDYLEPLFADAGFQTQKVPIPKEMAGGKIDRVNLLAHRRNPGKPRLIFYGHIDVVPAQGWEAFTPRVENGRVYGRGASDMKGGIAALLLALDAIKDKPLKYDTSVMITTDEEVGQADQLRYLGHFLEPLAGSYFFDLDSSFGYVAIAGLGALGMVVKVKGKSVHSAMSHLGENAVENAVPVLNALINLKKKVVLRKSKTDAEPDSGLTKMEARLNINMVQGGLKQNIIPDECTIAIDRRLIPEENIVTAEKEMMETLNSVPGVTWEIEQVFRIPTVPPVNDPIVDELAEVIRNVTGATGKYGEMGSGDFGPIATLEWQAKHFGAGVIRPDSNIHGKDEFANQKDITDLAVIISSFISP